MSATMRAVRFHEYGDSDVLILETVPRPVPGAGEVLVRVRFSGVNPLDWKLRSGMLKDDMPILLPWTPGREFSGDIEELGPGVAGFSVGQRVFGNLNGTYADFVVAKLAEIAPIPDTLSLEEAASAPQGALTAWYAVEQSGLAPGGRVIVIGAAGGVGMFAAQWARLKGAAVTGLASAKNQGFVKALGADPVDYGTAGTASLSGTADVVIDTVGGAALEGAYSFVRKGGLLVTVAGMPSEAKAAEAGIRAASSGNRGPRPLGLVADLLAQGKLKAEPGAVFDIAEAASAQDLSRTGHGRGRILLKL